MHGIHHSVIHDEINSNWSSGLTLWDRLHRTLRLDLDQSAIDVGVPAYPDAGALGPWELLALPFRPVRNAVRGGPDAHWLRAGQ